MRKLLLPLLLAFGANTAFAGETTIPILNSQFNADTLTCKLGKTRPVVGSSGPRVSAPGDK
jgi:hypothetical protein